MEELKISEILSLIKDKVKIIILFAFMFGVLGFVYSSFIQVPMYKSSASLVLTKSNDSSVISSIANSITQGDLQMNQSLVTTYGEILKSRTLLSQVITNLGLDMSPSQLASEVSIEQVTGTQVIDISILDPVKERSDKINNNLIATFQKSIADIYGTNNLFVVDHAVPTSSAFNINVLKTAALFFVVGIVVAIAIIFLKFYFDDTFKDSENVEKVLGVKIMASVPLHMGKV